MELFSLIKAYPNGKEREVSLTRKIIKILFPVPSAISFVLLSMPFKISSYETHPVLSFPLTPKTFPPNGDSPGRISISSKAKPTLIVWGGGLELVSFIDGECGKLSISFFVIESSFRFDKFPLGGVRVGLIGGAGGGLVVGVEGLVIGGVVG